MATWRVVIVRSPWGGVAEGKKSKECCHKHRAADRYGQGQCKAAENGEAAPCPVPSRTKRRSSPPLPPQSCGKAQNALRLQKTIVQMIKTKPAKMVSMISESPASNSDVPNQTVGLHLNQAVCSVAARRVRQDLPPLYSSLNQTLDIRTNFLDEKVSAGCWDSVGHILQVVRVVARNAQEVVHKCAQLFSFLARLVTEATLVIGLLLQKLDQHIGALLDVVHQGIVQLGRHGEVLRVAHVRDAGLACLLVLRNGQPVRAAAPVLSCPCTPPSPRLWESRRSRGRVASERPPSHRASGRLPETWQQWPSGKIGSTPSPKSLGSVPSSLQGPTPIP